MVHQLVSRKILLVLALFAITSLQGVPFTVTTTVDNGDNTSPTPGSLREAIRAVNSGAFDAIFFAIPTSDPGYDPVQNTWTIAPPVALPPITSPVLIDGYEGAPGGAQPNTLSQGSNAVITIVIDGSNYTVGYPGGSNGAGLVFLNGSDGSVVRGLCITHWIEQGIFLFSQGDSPLTDIAIVGNFIGVMPDGITQAANQQGLMMVFTDSIAVGSPDVADRNIIDGNFFYFQNFTGSLAIVQSSNVVVVNNLIGLDRTGTKAVSNSMAGITIQYSNVTVGGATESERNIIAGQVVAGIDITAVPGTGPVSILGNYIGTDVTGTKAIPSNFGIFMQAADTVNIGGPDPAMGNLISGNKVAISVTANYFLPSGPNGPLIQNNLIGTDVTGLLPLSNKIGISINNTSLSAQGTAVIANNIIAANTVQGILAYSATDNVITENLIGINMNQNPLGNGVGIQLGLIGGKGYCTQTVIGS